MKRPILPEQKSVGLEKIAPPYLPYATLKNFLDNLRVGIPGQIDRSVMRSLSGSAQSMLIGALRYFDLVNGDGKPSAALHKLVNAEGDERKKLIRDLLKSKYPFLFGEEVSLENATPRQVHTAFENAGVSGDTVRKAVVFFLSAAKDADLPMSPHLKVRRAPKVASPRRRNATGKTFPGPSEPQDRESEAPVSAYDLLIGILDPEAMDEEEQKAVWTLIKYLKKRQAEAED